MKIKNNTDRDESFRGVDFPKGKGVTVDDEALAQKVLGIDGFDEVKTSKKAAKDG